VIALKICRARANAPRREGAAPRPSGQLGDGRTTDRATPTPIASLADVASIAAGSKHHVAVKRDGTAWAWGRNNDGQLGSDGGRFSSNPAQVRERSRWQRRPRTSDHTKRRSAFLLMIMRQRTSIQRRVPELRDERRQEDLLFDGHAPQQPAPKRLSPGGVAEHAEPARGLRGKVPQ